jgi:predicted  nucleic acid-binding Zn-ribbon protein
MRNRWPAVCCLLVLACNAEERRLTERLRVVELQHATLSQRLQSRRNALDDAESRLDALNRDLTGHNTEVHAFIDAHKVAAACIRASRTSWGDDNSFASEVSAAQRFGAALCGIALLDADFAREVAHVADKLGEADRRVKELNEQIAALRRTIEADRRKVDEDHAAVEQLEAEAADVKYRLGTPVSDKRARPVSSEA